MSGKCWGRNPVGLSREGSSRHSDVHGAARCMWRGEWHPISFCGYNPMGFRGRVRAEQKKADNGLKEDAMYDARVVANAILRRAWDRGYDITQIDIQKITYFINGHFLRDHGRPLISTEFEAWEYGPVQRLLYSAFKEFGDQPITRLATSFDPVRQVAKELPPFSDNAAVDTLEKYLPRYLDVESFELVERTHAVGTPWSITRSEAGKSVNIGMRIASETIAKHFEGIGTV